MCTSTEESSLAKANMLDNSQITTILDDFIQDKDETIWICKLDNGLTVYQDDDRPGLEPSAWIRLGNYCRLNKVNIIEMIIKFRSHEELVGREADGHFFRRAILGGLGLNRKEIPVSRHYFITGVLKDGKVYTTKWQVPELMLIEEDVRDPDDENLVGVSLIRNT